MKFQRNPIEAVDIEERHRDDPGSIVGTKRYVCRNRGRHGNETLAHRSSGVFDAATGVLQAGVIQNLVSKRDTAGRDLDGQRPGRDDLVIDVDLVEHRKAHDAGSMLPDRAAPEAR